MVIIQEKLISREVLERQFICNLKACKGACCWEGDYGAPLEEAELDILENIYDNIQPFLEERGRKAIEEKGKYTWFKKPKEYGTTLLENGACAYMVYKDGKADCGIEIAHRAGASDFKKPISCHLYPVRVQVNPHTLFESLNYDEWEICSAACELGQKEQMPVYRFLKEAIIRKYGQEFYKEMEQAAGYLEKKKRK